MSRASELLSRSLRLNFDSLTRLTIPLSFAKLMHNKYTEAALKMAQFKPTFGG